MAKLKNHLKNVSSRRYDEAIFVLLRRALRGFDVTRLVSFGAAFGGRCLAMTVTVFLSCTKKIECFIVLTPKMDLFVKIRTKAGDHFFLLSCVYFIIFKLHKYHIL